MHNYNVSFTFLPATLYSVDT